MNKLRVSRLGDVIHIKKEKESDFFYSDGSTIFMISLSNLLILLKFLLYKDLVSHKVLEGILSEYYDSTRN
jgi:hypothetical protein